MPVYNDRCCEIKILKSQFFLKSLQTMYVLHYNDLYSSNMYNTENMLI